MSKNPKHSTYDAGLFETDTHHKYSDGQHSGHGKTREEALNAYNEAKDRNLSSKDHSSWFNRNSFLGDGDYLGSED